MSVKKSPIDGKRRVFVALATSEYAEPTLQSIDCADEVKIFRDWLCAESLTWRRFSEPFPDLALDPSSTRIENAFKDGLSALSHDDALFVYITGHGHYADGKHGGEHYLLLKNTTLEQYASTAIRTATLISWIREHEVEDVVLLIDVCVAGKATPAAGNLPDFPETWLALSASSTSPAGVGVLADCVKTYLDTRKISHGESLLRSDFIIEVGNAARACGQNLSLFQNELPNLGTSSCLPNPAVSPTSRPIIIYKAGTEAKRWVPGKFGPDLQTAVSCNVEYGTDGDVVVTPDGAFAVLSDGLRLLVAEANLEQLSVHRNIYPVDLSRLAPGRLLAIERAGSGYAFLGLWADDSGTWLVHLPAGEAAVRIRLISEQRKISGTLMPTMALVGMPDAKYRGPSPTGSEATNEVSDIAALYLGTSHFTIVSGIVEDDTSTSYLQLNGGPWIQTPIIHTIEVDKSKQCIVFQDRHQEKIEITALFGKDDGTKSKYAGWVRFGYRDSAVKNSNVRLL
ncbi:hypothetical protein HZU40_31340 [Mycolicibacterium fluoranthenivorans]|uniref:Caspase domain-containing protein n=1 Tax=Mycolicibacterium fluoranthenivorans TaxID=258505 RepID=A0A7G8PDZ9_9MYCO|nr:hypothetical protein [Mycolicibacterium fluoranthenivorans]QNJ92565.1 hypothetical protein HZU40_31340 [Mycolicibacterium fluoranthenivorans]